MPVRPRPPQLLDYTADTTLTGPGPGETWVLRVDLDPEPGCDDLVRLPDWRFLCDEEQARARRFIRPRDGRRFAVCRGSLRVILGLLSHVPPQAVSFRFGAGGKPELSQRGALGVHFNVTHSDELALIAVSRDRQLGVDIERVRTISEAARIVTSYFTAAEQAQFAAITPEGRDTAFLRGWTRKEAILKAKGVGLAGLATAYETMFGTAALASTFSPVAPRPRVGDWELWETEPRPGYVAALALAADDVPAAPPRSRAPSPEHAGP